MSRTPTPVERNLLQRQEMVDLKRSLSGGGISDRFPLPIKIARGDDMKKDLSLKLAQDVLKIEAESISGLIGKLNDNFTRAVDTIYKSSGRVIVTGIGKSGLIGKKIVATMTSTGTQALFLHPVEGMHGDLGIVTKRDVVLAISNSGETKELNTIVASVREIGATLIALTGDTSSTLARACDLVIDVAWPERPVPSAWPPPPVPQPPWPWAMPWPWPSSKRENSTKRISTSFIPAAISVPACGPGSGR